MEYEFDDDGLGGSQYTKLLFGASALIGMMALGALLAGAFSTAKESPTASAKQGLPVVPLHVQAQQAAIDAMHAQQQVLTEMRMRMAEAESGFYGEDVGYGHGRFYEEDFADGGW